MANRKQQLRAEGQVGTSAASGIEVRFDAIRDDWYKANQLMPRLIRRALLKKRGPVFRGFPRQWIPIFEYLNLAWEDCIDPREHIPIISEVTDNQLRAFCGSARSAGTLRTMVEGLVALDATLSDLLYILDNTTELAAADCHIDKDTVRLTSWQSYGRAEIRHFDSEVEKLKAKCAIAVLLPCARKRPYHRSRTHRGIWSLLAAQNIDASEVDQIVVTGLGIVPEELWSHPVVLKYDTGVPDIYRVLRLARSYFRRNRYGTIVNCLQFQPYLDIVGILEKEGSIVKTVRGPIPTGRQFYIRHARTE